MAGFRTLIAAAVALFAAQSSAQNVLSAQAQNGASSYGSLAAEPLAKFVDSTSTPWGVKTVLNTNPYDDNYTPNTGKTRKYTFTLTNQTMAPDGIPMPMLVVNGQFPGPLIEANWGDWIEVTVVNKLAEGTAMHWHGFLQTGTPYYDGTPGISQCPIAPGQSFTYRIRASLYGTSWYHSHYSSQYIQGISGPIVIHGPASAAYDVDLGPVMLTDWFQYPDGKDYKSLVRQIQIADPFGPILPPQAKNMLINGKATYPCDKTNLTCLTNASIAKFKFKTGKKHLLRLINHGVEGVMFFSIDGYNMTVISNDFVPIKPYVTDLITLGVGQRTDIIVEAIGKPTDSVLMRLTDGPPGNVPGGGIQPQGQGGCNIGDGIKYTTVGAIYYPKADTSKTPNTTTEIATSRYITPAGCNNDALDLTEPVYAMPVKTPDKTLYLTVTGGYNASGDFVWWMNNITFLADLSDPLMSLAAEGDTSFLNNTLRASFDFGPKVKVLRIVMNAVGFPAAHPMHLHGHNFQVLANGRGTWDNTTITRPANPQRRDTHIMGPLGYSVFQWELNNWGIWPFHCHIAWHTSQGMVLNVVEQKAKLVKQGKLPKAMKQTCDAWNAFTAANLVDVFDSGI